jgi:hypothetical protein|tara:strand:- start:921 stop:1307 length:387 start_codon:yes stop_codon:yes gene_type:complete
MPRSTPEYHLHVEVVAYLRLVLPAGSLLHHSPNEGEHRVQYRKKLARLGMCAGWPDLQLVVPLAYYLAGQREADIYIELKAPNGRVSPAQRKVIDALKAARRHVDVCRSVDDVQAFVGGIVRLKDVGI